MAGQSKPLTYTLSLTGERRKVTEQNKTTDYSYDALSRLLTESITDPVNGDYEAVYTYDSRNKKFKQAKIIPGSFELGFEGIH